MMAAFKFLVLLVVVCTVPGLCGLYHIHAFSNLLLRSIAAPRSRGRQLRRLRHQQPQTSSSHHDENTLLLLYSSFVTSITGNTTRIPIEQASEEIMITDEGIEQSRTVESPSRALEHFLSTCESLQQKQGLNDGTTPQLAPVQIISRGSKVPSLIGSVIPIKSLVFVSGSDSGNKVPFLVVLPEEDRVDLTKLNAILKSSELAPSCQVEELCGFPPKQVPPLGHSTTTSNAPLQTYIDQGLVDQMVATTQPPILLGGGGHPYWSSLVSLEVLLALDHVIPVDVKVDKVVVNGDSCSVGEQEPSGPESASSSSSMILELQPKPFFPVAPPPLHVAQLVLQQRELSSPLTPTMVTVVGRVGGVRQMAKRLAFFDLIPPIMNKKNKRSKKASGESSPGVDNWPWRYSNIDGTATDMAVQLIAGKTLFRTLGNEQGEVALKSLKEGQLILVEAKTNVGNRESLANWVANRSFDLVVVEYQILEGSMNGSRANEMGASAYKHKPQSSSSQASETSALQFSLPPLTMRDLFCNETATTDHKEMELSAPTVVDDMNSIQAFAKDYMGLMESLTAKSGEETYHPEDFKSDTENQSRSGPTTGFVGIDCEWRPHDFAESPIEPQPVLLLQISLHPLKHVYLFDLMALMRPLQAPSEPMNELEDALSDILGDLFSAGCLLKVGYQLPSDLRQLAASYPHVPCFQQVNSVLEISTLVKRALHITKQKRSRSITMSLARLTSHYLGRYMDKEQQVSDWASRPLTSSQVEYAALDAAVSPVLVEKTLESVDASIVGSSLPHIERWDGDSSFDKSVRSLRFIFLPPESDNMIRRLHAKQIVGSAWIATQDWSVGQKPPSELTASSIDCVNDDGPYTDAAGIRRVPSRMIPLQSSNSKSGRWEMLIGQRAGRSKDKCLDLLLDVEASLEKGAKIDYPQRSGYVEFEDGVALFVNNPDKSGIGRPRSYPNEWVEDGKYLTWFLRSRDWLDGRTDLAKKLISSPGSSTVALFVRMLNGQFLSCGRCRVSLYDEKTENEDTGDARIPSSAKWGLVQLNLELVDHEALSSCDDFRDLIGGMPASEG